MYRGGDGRGDDGVSALIDPLGLRPRKSSGKPSYGVTRRTVDDKGEYESKLGVRVRG